MVERLTHRLAQSLLLWDLALTLLCLYLASLLRYAISWGYDLPWTRIAWPWQLYLAVAVIWTTVFLLLTPQRRVFTSSLLELIGMLVTSVGLSSLTFAGLLYLSFRDVSRLQFIYFAALNLVVLLLFHLLARAYVRSRQARTSRRVLFVGAGPEAQHLARELGRHPWSGFQVVGFTSNEPVSSKIAPVLGMLAQVPNIVVEEEIDELIFALPPQEHEQVVRISLKLQHHAVMMHMVPGVLDLAFARTAVGTLGGIPLISLRE
jgi:FlaA1/EpsC-like NDP-sugar epimerase